MISMSEIAKIKTLVDKKGLSFNEISKITGYNWRTVKKWYYSKEFPQYNRKKNHTPIKNNIIGYIEKWIEEDIEMIKKGKIKKIRTDTKMYNDLVDMGIKCSERSVNRCSSDFRPKEVFIEQEYYPAEEMQVDWGIIEVDFENEIRCKVNIFVATLPYSNTKFVYPYMKSDTQSFFDGHIRAFEFFEGVPKRIRYDNLSSAVKKVLKGFNRVEQDKMIYFKTFFGFETNYCNVAKGNEKGSVENAVGYAKRRYLSGNIVFKGLDELRKYLYDYCKRDLDKHHYRKRKLIKELLLEEQSQLSPIPDNNFDNSMKILAKVRSTLMISYNGVRYSVPDRYCGKTVTIIANINKIKIYYNAKLIAEHERTHSVFCTEVYDYTHFLLALERKPRALSNAKCIAKSNFPPIFRKYLDGLNSRKENGNREMVRILLLNKNYSLKDIFFAMEWCYEHRIFSYDAVVLTLKDTTSGRPRIEAIKKAYPETKDMPLNLQKYDKLIGA